jgi:multiple sugar transport system substrate-binding protein
MEARPTLRIAVRKFAAFEAGIAAQWQHFEQMHATGYSLDVQVFELRDLYATLFDEGGLRNGKWDLAFMNTDWIALALHQDAVADLAPWLRSHPPESYPQGWPQSLLRLQNVGGVVAGVPYHDGPECLIYRKDLFDDPIEQHKFKQHFGYELSPPGTWAGFHDVAKYFHRPESGLYGTGFARLPDGHNSIYDFLLQLWTRGGDLTLNDGRVHLTSGPAQASLEYLRALANDVHAMHPNSNTMDSVALGASFAAGELAMMVNWFGFAVSAHTSFFKEGAAPRGKRVGVAAVPKADSGLSVSMNVYWLLAIGAGSSNKPLAYRFLSHCMRSDMDKLLTLGGAIGCRESTWEDSDVQRAIPFCEEMKYLHAAARELPLTEQWPHIAHILDDLVSSTTRSTIPIKELVQTALSRFDGLPRVGLSG